MTKELQDAFNLVSQASGLFAGNREQHVKVQEALNVLQKFIEEKTLPISVKEEKGKK